MWHVKIFIAALGLVLLSTQIIAWRGKVFAVNGRKVTVISSSKNQPGIGAKIFITLEDFEIGHGVVSANFHSKTEVTLKSGKAMVGAIVIDQIPAKPAEKKVVSNSDQDAALLAAAFDGTEEEAKAAIAAGANVNMVDHNGYSVAMVAARRANAPVLKVLIDAKANLSVKDPRGRTIFTLPEPGVFPEVKKILDEARKTGYQ